MDRKAAPSAVGGKPTRAILDADQHLVTEPANVSGPHDLSNSHKVHPMNDEGKKFNGYSRSPECSSHPLTANMCVAL